MSRGMLNIMLWQPPLVFTRSGGGTRWVTCLDVLLRSASFWVTRRYDASHKEQTRQRVISEAAAAIRRKGPERVPVSEIMAAAGLTHGGFYAHLRSKDDVVAQAIGQMFDAAYANLLARTESRPSAKGLADYIDSYSRPPTAWISLMDVRSRPRPEPYTKLSDEPRGGASGAVPPRVMSVDRGGGAIDPSRANPAGFASSCRRGRGFATAGAPPPFLPVPTRRAPRHS